MRTSGTPTAHQGAATLRDYLQVVRRRKWIIIQAVVLVPLAAVLFSLQQTPVYQASADVLLSRQNLANTLNGLQDPSLYTQSDRLAQTQADIARSPAVGKRVLAQLHLTDRSVREFLGNSSVSPAQNADVLG
ncbi:MAG TPA: Wzz/FepE/Etk N-terminal domain-containing protein, partial [Gaiellaceae bacterium]